MIISYALFCYRSIARSVPTNYILLSIYTLGEAYLLSYVVIAANPQHVLIAFLLTSGLTITLTIYACTTKNDFTFMGGFLFVCAFALLAFGILALTFHSPILTKVYCALGVLLTGVYIIFDT